MARAALKRESEKGSRAQRSHGKRICSVWHSLGFDVFTMCESIESTGALADCREVHSILFSLQPRSSRLQPSVRWLSTKSSRPMRRLSKTKGSCLTTWSFITPAWTWSTSAGGFSRTAEPQPTKYTFPPSTVIAPQSFLIVWCDELTNSPTGLHAPFTLKSKEGDDVTLFNSGFLLQDIINFGIQMTDHSVGRVPDGSSACGN